MDLTEFLNCSHSRSLADRGSAVRGDHRIPLGEDGSLPRNILLGDSHLLKEDIIGHHGTLTGDCGLLLLGDFDAVMEVVSPVP